MALLIGITPLEQPDPALAQALLDAGALGVLDLGRDRDRAAAALAALARRATGFGVRLPEEGAFDPAELPAAATTVITSDPAAIVAFRGRRVLVQVTTPRTPATRPPGAASPAIPPAAARAPRSETCSSGRA